MLQFQKAAIFRQLHTGTKLLILPNIWDLLSARLIASIGFPALATASVSVAAVNGYQDGEQIPLEVLLKVVSNITASVDLPVTVDFERGYANSSANLKENIKRLLDAGAVGINLEDGKADESGLVPVVEQCRKIELIRDTAFKEGIDLVINARTDIYLQAKSDNMLAETIERAKAYKHAGANCFYPIMINNFHELEQLVNEVQIPINVLLIKSIGDLRKLEETGIKRVSLGPAVLKYMLAKIKNMALELKSYSTESLFNEELITNHELKHLIAGVENKP